MHDLLWVKDFPRSFLLRADRPASYALVFVHGFGGNANTTWSDVQQLVDTRYFASAFESIDLFFLDYRSARDTIAVSAIRLREFLERVMTFESPSKPPYEKVRLVGHSTGCVVIRQLMLDLAKNTVQSEYRNVLLGSTPLLFSPAHFGFKHNQPALMIAQLSRFAVVAASFWQWAWGRVYADLQPSSPILVELKEQTVITYGRDTSVHALPAALFWGQDENVVYAGEYLIDRRRAAEKGYDHFAVCKPS